jgi:hypothetical protein
LKGWSASDSPTPIWVKGGDIFLQRWLFISNESQRMFHPGTQETTPACLDIHKERKPKTAQWRASTALAVEECINGRYTISTINVSCFGGFRSQADDPPTCSPNKFFGRREPWGYVPEGFTVGGQIGVGGYGFWGPRLRAEATARNVSAKAGTSTCRHGLARGAPFLLQTLC